MNWTGLAALVWDIAGGDDPHTDIDFIKKIVGQNGGMALDVGCGTGRVMLRLLAEGMDVEGIDTSADMLSMCREKAAARGLNPTLYEGYMQDLDLHRHYRTIFIPCGTFCLVTDREQAVESLHRFYKHLEPGGTLVFSLFWVFSPGEPLSNSPTATDANWKPLYDTTLPDGRVVRQHMRLNKLDRTEQLFLAERRYQLYEGEQMVAEEIFPANERWYFKHEMVMLLEKVGFRDIQVKGDWTDADFHDDHHSVIVFVAKK